MKKIIFMSYQAWPTVSFARPGGGGGVRDPDAKNQDYDQLIEIKFCMSLCSHKSMADAKSESGNFSGFGDMTPQNLSSNKKA